MMNIKLFNTASLAKKKLFIGVVALLALASSSSIYASKSLKSGGAKEVVTIEGTIEQAKSEIAVCGSLKTLYGISVALHNKSRIQQAHIAVLSASIEDGTNSYKTERDLDRETRKKVLETEDRNPPSPHDYEKCVSDGKHKVIEMGKKVSRSQPKLSGKIKDMVAQWITVMDSLDRPSFDDEKGKFETLANRLLLE